MFAAAEEVLQVLDVELISLLISWFDACRVTLSFYPHRASSKICLTTAAMESTSFGMLL